MTTNAPFPPQAQGPATQHPQTNPGQGQLPGHQAAGPGHAGAAGPEAQTPARERPRSERLAGARSAATSVQKKVTGATRSRWDRIRPTVGIVTVLGWIVLGTGLVTLIAGLILGWIELIALGGVLLIAFLAAIPFVLGRNQYEVTIELNPKRVTVGDRALGRLDVKNAGDDRALPTRMEFRVGKGQAEFGIPSLQPGQSHEELFSVPTSRRAVIPTGPAQSVRGDELGLLRRSVKWTGEIELFVHPRTIRLAPSAAGVLRDLEGAEALKIADMDLAFHALRPYERGDDRRAIHWKTSARTGQLMVRQFQETRKSQLTIVHTLNPGLYANDEEFELAISVLGSIVSQSIAESLEVSVVNEWGEVPTRSTITMLDATSRFEPMEPRHNSLRAFVVDATRKLPPPTVLIVVAGSRLDRGELRSIQSLYSNDVETVAFICDVSASSARTRSRGLTTATVGKLEDLPKLVAA